MQLQSAAMFTVVGILAVGEVFGHQTQGSCGKCSTDEVEHQHTFDLLCTIGRKQEAIQARKDGDTELDRW